MRVSALAVVNAILGSSQYVIAAAHATAAQRNCPPRRLVRPGGVARNAKSRTSPFPNHLPTPLARLLGDRLRLDVADGALGALLNKHTLSLKRIFLRAPWASNESRIASLDALALLSVLLCLRCCRPRCLGQLR